tara:strand:+ start:450 stop:920 length:471 start_codon:yes stop_codon:yes gene_type:complete
MSQRLIGDYLTIDNLKRSGYKTFLIFTQSDNEKMEENYFKTIVYRDSTFKSHFFQTCCDSISSDTSNIANFDWNLFFDTAEDLRKPIENQNQPKVCKPHTETGESNTQSYYSVYIHHPHGAIIIGRTSSSDLQKNPSLRTFPVIRYLISKFPKGKI